MSPAVILFAHGARDPAWARPFEAIAAQMRSARPGATVQLAFLELMEPRLPAAVADLVAQGLSQIEVVPVFLGAGGHVKRDLPELLAQCRAAHAGLEIRATPAIGEAEVIVRAIAQAAWTLVDDTPAAAA